MIEVQFVIPGDIDTPTGGYAYDRQVIAHLKNHGVSAAPLALPADFPFPSASSLGETAAALTGGAGKFAAVIIDGLAYGAMPEAVIAKARGPVIALVHHPLAYEAGLTKAQQRGLYGSERAALALARHIIVTSPATAAALVQDFGLEAGKITVAMPGTEAAHRAIGGNGETVNLLAVGSLTPRKGYDVLVAALSLLSHLPWRLIIAGSADRDGEIFAAIRDQITGSGLQDRINIKGALPAAELAALYARADIFTLASRYEGFGMAFTEAMARGLPIVASSGGATAQTVPQQAGLLVAPDDANAFAAALGRMISDGGLRKQYADGAWAHAQTLPRWSDTAAIIANVIKRVAS